MHISHARSMAAFSKVHVEHIHGPLALPVAVLGAPNAGAAPKLKAGAPLFVPLPSVAAAPKENGLGFPKAGAEPRKENGLGFPKAGAEPAEPGTTAENGFGEALAETEAAADEVGPLAADDKTLSATKRGGLVSVTLCS